MGEVEWAATGLELAGSDFMSPAVERVGRRASSGRGEKRKRGEAKGRGGGGGLLVGGEGGGSVLPAATTPPGTPRLAAPPLASDTVQSCNVLCCHL